MRIKIWWKPFAIGIEFLSYTLVYTTEKNDRPFTPLCEVVV